jgi:hypothetical protein
MEETASKVEPEVEAKPSGSSLFSLSSVGLVLAVLFGITTFYFYKKSSDTEKELNALEEEFKGLVAQLEGKHPRPPRQMPPLKSKVKLPPPQDNRVITIEDDDEEDEDGEAETCKHTFKRKKNGKNKCDKAAVKDGLCEIHGKDTADVPVEVSK